MQDRVYFAIDSGDVSFHFIDVEARHQCFWLASVQLPMVALSNLCAANLDRGCSSRMSWSLSAS